MNTGIEAHSADQQFRDRRAGNRFPVREDVSYKLVSKRYEPVAGAGKTIDFSSRGVLFTTKQKLPVGSQVEISVNWPAQLGGICPLKFVATARVVRSDDEKAAVRIERYEFRTRGVSLQRLN